MKVKIGPYKSWIGPYQIADALLLWPKTTYSIDGDPSWRERWSDKLGDWFAHDKHGNDSWLTTFCNWLDKYRSRQVYVHIDNYDVWNMDETLRLIIGPMFVKLKQQKQGSGYIDDADVPEHLRSTAVAKPENEWDLDANFHLRYEWLLDEMIWAFTTDHYKAREAFYDHSQVDHKADVNTQVQQMQLDKAGLEAYDTRVTNAYRLFGKYYQTFWD